MTPEDAAKHQRLLAECQLHLDRGERIKAIKLYRSRTNAILATAISALNLK